MRLFAALQTGHGRAAQIPRRPPRVTPFRNHAAVRSWRFLALDDRGAKSLVIPPRPYIVFEDPKVQARGGPMRQALGQRIEQLCTDASAAALRCNVKIVQQRPPDGIVVGQCEREANGDAIIGREQADVVGARLCKPLPPEFPALGDDRPVQVLVIEDAAIRRPPAPRMKIGYGFDVGGLKRTNLHDVSRTRP